MSRTLKSLVPSKVVRILLVPVVLTVFIGVILLACCMAFSGDKRDAEMLMDGYVEFIS